MWWNKNNQEDGDFRALCQAYNNYIGIYLGYPIIIMYRMSDYYAYSALFLSAHEYIDDDMNAKTGQIGVCFVHSAKRARRAATIYQCLIAKGRKGGERERKKLFLDWAANLWNEKLFLITDINLLK